MRTNLLLLLLLVPSLLCASNTQTTRSTQITSQVNVGVNTDYILSRSASIFSSSGSLNIPASAMEHSVVIFKAVKPSVVISTWLSHIKINGTTAVNGTNCQVKMYNKGAIVLPYSSSLSPLTCYSGTGFSGSSCKAYSTGSEGGYMKTLTVENLLNDIRSFKLKRGYMVTFATGTSGYGYSRCFVADTEDLEMDLPAVLAGKVSSYRLFQWYNFGKSGIANNTDAAICDSLNVQGCYTYNVGGNRLPDVEWIPHKIHKNWPGIAECGNTEYACTMKTDNEPANSNDDTPATVDEVLAYWENAMRTGMRLCSPSSHDGGYAWQEEFMNKIDERGWRCDILDMHCYWVTGSFSSLSGYYDKYKRPIWVTEWLWGASWNSNGAFGSGVTDSQIVSNTSNILNTLNNAAYVERYFYWNSESKAKIYNGGLTTLGKTYASTDGGLGYKSTYAYIPKVVINIPYSLKYTANNTEISLSWKDKNGDMIDEILIQYKDEESTTWNTLTSLSPQDKTNGSDQSYSYSGTLANADSYIWRVANVFDGTIYATSDPVFLYNDESGLFIGAGASWDTRSIASETGIDFILTETGNGKYTLDSNISNGGTAHYLGSNLYCDSNSSEWTFSEDGTIDGQQTYTISDDEGFLTAPQTAGGVITRSATPNNRSKWLLLTRRNLIRRMASATEDHPVDATFLLPGANFGRNDARISQWQGSPTRGGYAQSDWGDLNGEKYNCTFDVYQVIGDAPDGIYKLSCQGFYRYGGDGATIAAEARQNGAEALNALLYANDQELALPSIFEGAGECGETGKETSFGYVPNGQSEASQYIHKGLYASGVLRFTVENGNLRVGVRKTTPVDRDWTVFDNFRLLYLGPAYTLGDINRDGSITIADVTALVNIILGKDSTKPYAYDHRAADVNQDSSITIADVTALVNLILGK